MKFLVPLIFFASAMLLASPLVAAAAGTTRPALAAGPVEKDGLQVTLAGDKTDFARNEPIRFTLRFKNVSDKPLSLSDAGDFGTWLVRLDGVAGGMPWRLQGRAAAPPKPSEPAGELGPGETREITTRWGSNDYPFQYESELVQNMPIPPADSLWPGRYRVWVGITLKKDPEANAPHLAFRGDINIGPVEIEVGDKDDPAGPCESEAVREASAEFQTVTRAVWAVPPAGEQSEVLLGLKVTNRAGPWMQLNTFDTLRVVLKDGQGAELPCIGERDATLVPEPLLLMSREGRTVYRNATLQRSPDGKGLRLIGSDGAGGTWHFDGLRPGRYAVHFVFESNDDTLKAVLRRPARHAIDPKEAPFWMGKVTIKAVDVEIAEAPATAVPAGGQGGVSR